VGGRFDSARDASEGIKLSPYSLVNLSGTYWFSKNVGVIARIENLLDEDYEEIKSFGTKGASFYGGLRVKL
jgi:vitamin B12 transporter